MIASVYVCGVVVVVVHRLCLLRLLKLHTLSICDRHKTYSQIGIQFKCIKIEFMTRAMYVKTMNARDCLLPYECREERKISSHWHN